MTGTAERAALAVRWTQALTEALPVALELRHVIHAHPELSGYEHGTSRLAAEFVSAPSVTTVAGTGRLLRVGPAGPSVAIRAELDALPGTETSTVPWRSQVPGAVHACGHDVHLAAAVALARAALRVDLPCGLLLILQPREELAPSGARAVVESGLLVEHDVRALIGVHVQPQVRTGAVAADPGSVNAGVDEFVVAVTGHGGHSAYPHLANDPVPGLVHCVSTMAEAVAAVVDPMRPAVLTTTMLAAGVAPNVIPETASAQGTLRTFEPGDRERMHQRMHEIVVGVSAAHGCAGRLQIRPGELPVINDPALTAAARAQLVAAGITLAGEFRSCGSDDFAAYGSLLPSLMMFLGAGDPADPVMLHDSRFVPPDELVGEAARVLMAGYLAAAARLA